MLLTSLGHLLGIAGKGLCPPGDQEGGIYVGPSLWLLQAGRGRGTQWGDPSKQLWRCCGVAVAAEQVGNALCCEGLRC